MLSANAAAGGKHPAFIYEAIRAGQPYHFRTKSPLEHNIRNLLCTATLLLVWGVTLSAGTWMNPWAYVPIASLVFGWLYFSLFVLVVHEASHGMYLVAENRTRHTLINRVPGWFVASLFAVHYGKHWERGHLEHHVRPLEVNDPQRFNNSIGRELALSVAKNVLIPGWLVLERTVFRTRRAGGKSSSSKGVLIAFVLIWATGLTLSAMYLGGPVAVAGFLGIHVLTAWNLVKGALEHGGALGDEPDPFFRSRTTLFLGRRVLMPFNITLHFEHHLNFCVPWYDLPKYQRDLKTIVPDSVFRDLVNSHPWQQLAGHLGGLSAESTRCVSVASPPP